MKAGLSRKDEELVRYFGTKMKDAGEKSETAVVSSVVDDDCIIATEFNPVLQENQTDSPN